MSFDSKDYFEEKFVKLEIKEEVVEFIEFDKCIFVDCVFEKTRLFSCKFMDCKFERCVFGEVKVSESTFMDNKFLSCKMMGLDWTEGEKLTDLKFEKCQMSYSNFRMLELSGVEMNGCVAEEVDFSQADLSSGVFDGTDFKGSVFLSTNLFKTSFVGAKNYQIDVKKNNVAGATFSLPEALDLLNSLGIVLK